jgi:hypothetical protein
MGYNPYDDDEKYDFLLVIDEDYKRYEEHQKLIIPPQSPMNSTSLLSNDSLSKSSLPSPLRKMRSLNDLYGVSNPIDDDLTLYFHLVACEPIMFKKDNKERKIEN